MARLGMAAAMSAIAACTAAAAPSSGKEEAYYTISLTEARAQPGSKGEQLEIHSFQWGSAATPYKLDRVFVKSWSTSGDAGNGPPSGGGRSEMKLDDDAGAEEAKDRQAGMNEMSAEREKTQTVGGSQSMTIGGAHSESQATGKRQHKPMVMRGYYDTSSPPPTGSLTVLARGGACRAGTRYPSVALNGGGKSYLLQEVRVVDCGGAGSGPEESITFVYGKVQVRGWDPKKKEE